MRKSQEHQLLEELQSRGRLSPTEEKELFIRRVGFEGELEAFQLISDYKKSEWQLLNDLTFNHDFGEIQVDLLLITQLGWWVFEVKNYDSDYEYRDGKWLVNGRPKARDDFAQLKRTMEIFKNIHRSSGSRGELVGKLLFINESDSVEIVGADSALYLKRAKLKRYLQELAEDCTIFIDDTVNIEREAQWLLSWTEKNLRLKSITDDRFESLRKGIYCYLCRSFNTEVVRFHVCCHACGSTEASEKAILRTICGYGVLFPYKNLKTSEVLSLFGGQVKYYRVNKILKKYFEVSSSKGSFINPINSFEYQFLNIKFRYIDKRNLGIKKES
ncbi:nuclease-related domain-containing protein [Fundicoccus sp. Sow4_H7]|uniref:nuclease-related domain-containing protein n=1 Tax=Fundicoccus sp. Sow4_H7 TaxID=3438784 RepID=UPI003F92845D